LIRRYTCRALASSVLRPPLATNRLVIPAEAPPPPPPPSPPSPTTPPPSPSPTERLKRQRR